MPEVAGPPVSREQLEELVREYHHVLEEHRRAHRGGSVRRHMKAQLAELERRFEERLHEWVAEEEARAAWRAHLHGDFAEPTPPIADRPLVYRGRAETGSVVEIRRRADGDYDVEVDGCSVERIEGELDFSGAAAPHRFTLDGIVFDETFSSSEPALEALDAFVAERESSPPWRFATELAADGLIDECFGLTPRGHRALRARRR
jgi:hypothetical protein